MKNKIILSLLMFFHASGPITAFGLNDLKNLSTNPTLQGSMLLSKKWYEDPEIQELAIRLGIILVFTYISIKMQMDMMSGDEFYDIHKAGTLEERFDSVAGNEDAKDALSDIIDYLQDPSLYQEMGAIPPKGVLLTGDPGTGKTLLARALAGEANCPFISTTGPSFSAMFIGVGSMRIKKLFNIAKSQKKNFFWQQPCIIFVDEFDALAKKRGSSFGNSEDNKTLNELLIAMDGFAKHGVPVIVIGATNHVDNLDPAILRPGRFDRIVSVNLPDAKTREEILKIHLKKIKHDPKLNIKKVAHATPGFSGAALENLVNQAAIAALKKSISHVTMQELEEAKDKVTIGSPSKSMILNDYEKKVTAYHEAGHALISMIMTNPMRMLHKVTILPRAGALGVTHFLPEKDIYQISKEDMLSIITMALGGRAAEELEFGLISSGPSNDFQQATEIARAMVTKYGMSDVLGKQVLLTELTRGMQYSQETLAKIDQAVTKILDEQFEVATNLLKTNKDKLDTLAHALLEKETLDASEVYQLLGMKQKKDFRLV